MQNDEQLNELIIEEVKKYEFLYNNAHSDHGKRLPTQKTWEKISSLVGDTGRSQKRNHLNRPAPINECYLFQ